MTPFETPDGRTERMPTNRSSLGVCPRCRERISATRLLIEYETNDETRVRAERPDCEDVVHPEQFRSAVRFYSVHP